MAPAVRVSFEPVLLVTALHVSDCKLTLEDSYRLKLQYALWAISKYEGMERPDCQVLPLANMSG